MRHKREETGVSLLEVWDGTQLLQEKDSSTKAEVSRYLLQNDSYSGLRAQRLASDNTWRFFGYDVQGNTRLLLNSDGTSNLSLLYRAFGQKQASSGAGSTLMQFGAFYGYEWDADSRMWVKARHLSGTQGRWLSQDPIGFRGGDWNLWRYVENNPVIQFDPIGLRVPPLLQTFCGTACGVKLAAIVIAAGTCEWFCRNCSFCDKWNCMNDALRSQILLTSSQSCIACYFGFLARRLFLNRMSSSALLSQNCWQAGGLSFKNSVDAECATVASTPNWGKVFCNAFAACVTQGASAYNIDVRQITVGGVSINSLCGKCGQGKPRPDLNISPPSNLF